MTPWGNPDSWMDVFDHLWLGLVFIAVAGVPSWFAARNHRGISDLKKSVQNGHAEPLRADLDKALNAIEALASDFRGLRSDLAAEEERRRSAVADIYDELDHRIGRHRKQET